MPFRKNHLLVHIPKVLLLFLRVHFLRYILFAGFLVLVIHPALAQEQPERRRGSRIIDDTTKQVYGPNTSKYYYESDVFTNQLKYYPVDTVIRDFHRFNWVQRSGNTYQDLGNIGTAIRPIFYETPEVIGARSGFNMYDLYWDDTGIRYYDTKSPYSNMNVILGGRGRSITRANFSRNINPNWNFGFNYRGIFIDKQIQRIGKGDRNVRSNYYDIYTAYQTKDSTYRLFFNFKRQNHRVEEYGGVRSLSEAPLQYSEYFLETAQPKLTEAYALDLRMNMHFYHQYEVGRALQVYHVFDRYRQGNDFIDRHSLEPANSFIDNAFVQLEGDTTQDNVKFKSLRNEVGIKGNLLKLFYNGYYAIRDYSMHYKYIPKGVFYKVDPADTLSIGTSGVESYIGGRMALRLDSLVTVSGWAEVMNTGNFRIEGDIQSKWFEASLKQLQYAPTFAQQAYRGSHDYWNNDFSNVNVTRLNGYIHYRSKILNISPGLTFTRLGNYVFFKDFPESESQRVLPVQSSGQQVIFSPELRLSLTLLKHIHVRTTTIYSRLLDNPDDAIQLPEIFFNGQISYENIFFNGNLDMHAGVDLHWRSDYYANAYDVPAQQFYVQKTFLTPSFPLVDIFFNAKIKRGRIFVRYSNLIQAIRKEGYMTTPEYPGQRNIVDFGFDWSFYD